MKQTITVNGVAYENVDAMPPDVRRVYEQTMARFAGLASVGGGDPIVLHHQAGPLKITTTVQKSIAVNGTTYESEATMPPDARQAYAKALQAAHSGEPTVKRNEIKVAFQFKGPGFTLGRTLDAPQPRLDASPAPERFARPTPAPIEPTSAEGALRIALVVGGCAVIAFAAWLFLRIR